jgi:hypothetical protein
MPRDVKPNQRGYGPPGWPAVYPVDWDKDMGANQALDHHARPPEAPQGHLTGRVIDRNPPDIPTPQGGTTALERELNELGKGDHNLPGSTRRP